MKSEHIEKNNHRYHKKIKL